MLFNQGKCKCLHIGRSNGTSDYKIQKAVLKTIAKEKDIGVTIQADLKFLNSVALQREK